ncbi:hypothetical protein KJ632_03535 [Patescibacteria group bacterium]|nr:hypothetical protein [Patescibacteria group bacterium]
MEQDVISEQDSQMDESTKLLLDMSQQDLINQFKDTQALKESFAKLLTAVYQRKDLPNERRKLYLKTKKLDPNYESELLIPKMQLILEVRLAISKAMQATRKPYVDQNNNPDFAPLKGLVLDMQDGDLAHTTFENIGGHGSSYEMLADRNYAKFMSDLRFSPELQLEIAKSKPYAEILTKLAQNKYLTGETQLLLLNHEDGNVSHALVGNVYANSLVMLKQIFELKGDRGIIDPIHLAFTNRNFHPEIQQLLEADPKLSLIRKAKTDQSAELQMIDQAISNNDDIWMNYIAFSATLLSEKAVRRISKIKGNKLELNPNIRKHKELAKELGLELPE